MNLDEHPFWPMVRDYFEIQYWRGRPQRIEVLTMPEELARKAREILVSCPHCGDWHHPIRLRGKPEPPDAAAKASGHYHATACPPSDEKPGCSKGLAARREKERLIAVIEGGTPRSTPAPTSSSPPQAGLPFPC